MASTDTPKQTKEKAQEKISIVLATVAFIFYFFIIILHFFTIFTITYYYLNGDFKSDPGSDQKVQDNSNWRLTSITHLSRYAKYTRRRYSNISSMLLLGVQTMSCQNIQTENSPFLHTPVAIRALGRRDGCQRQNP